MRVTWNPHPLPRGPGVPFLLGPAWAMLWVSVCPALSLAELLVGLPGLISDLIHHFGDHLIVTGLSADPVPVNLAQGQWEGAQSVRALLLPVGGHPQLPAHLASWSSHALAAPWKWDWKVICFKTTLISLMLSHSPTGKHQDRYTQVVCPAFRDSDAWIQVVCPGVLLQDKDAGYWDLILSPGLFLGWELCADFCTSLFVPFRASQLWVSPSYPTSHLYELSAFTHCSLTLIWVSWEADIYVLGSWRTANL